MRLRRNPPPNSFQTPDYVPKKSVITDDYRILNSVLGQGISGKVLRCVHLKSRKEYALKVLEDTPAARREVNLHWRMSTCPNIVPIIDVYENMNDDLKKRFLLIIMECMSGGELFSRIKARSSFNESEAAEIVFQIASAVDYLHQRHIAHRDLKPENLLFSSDSNDAVLKLTDFGFAHTVVNANSLQTPCYTPFYVAPEILAKEKYGMSCDIWSLGVITYILLCGFPPFFSRNGAPISPRMQKNIIAGNYEFPPTYWGHISAEAKELIKNLLVTDPTKRLSSSEVMQHPWVSKHMTVPPTPLDTKKFLSNIVMDDVSDAMESELRSLRNDPESRTDLIPLEQSNNSLLQRRRNKPDS